MEYGNIVEFKESAEWIIYIDCANTEKIKFFVLFDGYYDFSDRVDIECPPDYREKILAALDIDDCDDMQNELLNIEYDAEKDDHIWNALYEEWKKQNPSLAKTIKKTEEDMIDTSIKSYVGNCEENFIYFVKSYFKNDLKSVKYYRNFQNIVNDIQNPDSILYKDFSQDIIPVDCSNPVVKDYSGNHAIYCADYTFSFYNGVHFHIEKIITED